MADKNNSPEDGRANPLKNNPLNKRYDSQFVDSESGDSRIHTPLYVDVIPVYRLALPDGSRLLLRPEAVEREAIRVSHAAPKVIDGTVQKPPEEKK